MFDPKPKEIVKMIQDLCSKHRGEMLSLVLDWDTIEINNPRYEGKIQQLVPLLVIDFK